MSELAGIPGNYQQFQGEQFEMIPLDPNIETAQISNAGWWFWIKTTTCKR